MSPINGSQVTRSTHHRQTLQLFALGRFTLTPYLPSSLSIIYSALVYSRRRRPNSGIGHNHQAKDESNVCNMRLQCFVLTTNLRSGNVSACLEFIIHQSPKLVPKPDYLLLLCFGTRTQASRHFVGSALLLATPEATGFPFLLGRW